MTEAIDIQAPILPNEGLGGVKLRTHIKEMYDLLNPHVYSHEWVYRFEGPFYVHYELKDTIRFVFHVLNGKLIKIGALEKYQGHLFHKIGIGMKVGDAANIEPRLYLDAVEDVLYIKDVPGVALETENPYLSPEQDPHQKIIAITVYIAEMHGTHWTKEHERGNW